MLSNCHALLAGSDKGWMTQMANLARQVGFESCATLRSERSLKAYRLGPLPFIFVHSRANKELQAEALAIVRGHYDLNLRFLPVILMTEERGYEEVKAFVKAGYDDVIITPCPTSTLMHRLQLQISEPWDYFQTSTYFGPDRRRLDMPMPENERRTRGGFFFRRFVVQRNARRGVQIVSTETYLPDKPRSLSA